MLDLFNLLKLQSLFTQKSVLYICTRQFDDKNLLAKIGMKDQVFDCSVEKELSPH